MSRRRKRSASGRPRPQPEPKSGAKLQATPVRVVLTLGAIAAAIASVLSLPSTVGALFHHDEPSATVTVSAATPMRYERFLEISGRSLEGHEDQLKVRGAAVNYEVVTEHIKSGAEVPVHFTVVNTSHDERPYTLDAVPLTVHGPRRCGCVDFAPAPRSGDSYQVTVIVLAPGSKSDDEPMSRATVAFRQVAP